MNVNSAVRSRVFILLKDLIRHDDDQVRISATSILGIISQVQCSQQYELSEWNFIVSNVWSCFSLKWAIIWSSGFLLGCILLYRNCMSATATITMPPIFCLILVIQLLVSSFWSCISLLKCAYLLILCPCLLCNLTSPKWYDSTWKMLSWLTCFRNFHVWLNLLVGLQGMAQYSQSHPCSDTTPKHSVCLHGTSL